jgi:L,D-transpeptidase ErfK/SrfK
MLGYMLAAGAGMGLFGLFGRSALASTLQVHGAQPDLAAGDRMVSFHEVEEGETLLDIARAYDLGFLEVKAANPGVDPWIPPVGSKAVLPTFHLLPKEVDKGILVNISAMRLFIFHGDGKTTTHPLGVGREGRDTPLGRTTVVRKKEGPAWYPTENIRKEKPHLPAMVPAGPDNPLGTHALYLGWPTYLIHGTNIPWGVGRRTSSGCLRMYPEDIKAVYGQIAPGMKVEVVDQPLVVKLIDGKVFMEAHMTGEEWDLLEQDYKRPDRVMKTEVVQTISAALPDRTAIDWAAAERVYKEARGYPVLISPKDGRGNALSDQENAAPPQENARVE